MNKPPLDSDAQPSNTSFNFSRNKDKALFGLKGILVGLVADQEINEQEFLFLDIWLQSQDEIRNDGDVVDLIEAINQILGDKSVTEEALADLKNLIDDVIQYREYEEGGQESRVNELLGLITGLAADDKIKSEEVMSLHSWLQNNPDLKDIWPTNVLIDRIENILEDGIITEQEKIDLREVIQQITGTRFEESGMAHGMATDFFGDDIEELIFDNSCFCFTGKFISGTRNELQDKAIKQGAKTHPRVTKNVDYLVIGSLASRDWRFSSHGRKIEDALKISKAGHKIFIITEETWVGHLEV